MTARQWNQYYEQQKQDHTTKITSAYHFVPLSKHIVFPDWAADVSHDKPFVDGLSGTLELTIKTHSPLLIGEQAEGEINPYRLPDNTLAIPGSSLRGMIRHVLEIASFGKMRYVDDKRYGVRDLQAEFYKDQLTKEGNKRGHYIPQSLAGWLTFKNDEWTITPCKMARVERYMLEAYVGKHKWVDIKKRPESDAKYKKWLTARKMLDVNFEDESPAYHAHSKGRIQLYYNKVKEVGTGSKHGQLVFTGQPGPQKHLEFVFYAEDSTKEFIVPSQIMQDFQHIYQDSKHWKYLKQATLFSQGLPIFYLKNNNEISSMGLSQMYRLAYKHSIGELIDKTNKEHRANNHLDLAEVIFGTVDEEDGKNSLKGRVNFSHAQCTTKNPAQETCQAILNSPKPTYYPNYIVQKEDNGQLKGREYLTFMDNNAEIRGWKRYPVRPADHVAIPKLSDDVLKKTDPAKRVWVVLHPITEAVCFTAKLRFHNLRPIELGAVAWCLRWGNDDSLKHAIGLGKAFGFGQIGISMTAEDIRPNKMGNSGSIDKCIEQFIEYMDKEMGQDWLYTEQIQLLMAMANPEVAKEKDEPLIPLDLDGGGRGNQFLNAKKANLVLKQYSQIKAPVLSADREWLERTLAEIGKKTNTETGKVLLAKGLAVEWQAIEDDSLRQQVKVLIKHQWGNHWEEGNTGSMKKAYKIYQENE